MFFGWLVAEGEADVSPMLRVEKPQVAEVDKPADDAVNDVYLVQRGLRIGLKGGRQTYIPVGKKTAAAIGKYLRVRAGDLAAAVAIPGDRNPWAPVNHA